MAFEGYAVIDNMMASIKDVPIFWSPLMVFPLKTRRQTGFLFPKISPSDGKHGFVFELPFFWAINRSSDMTFYTGFYGARGRRLAWEGRYVLTERSKATANYYHTKDTTFPKKIDDPNSRWGMKLYQLQELPWGFEEKVRLVQISDNLYPIDFSADVPGRTEPSTATDLMLSHTSSHLSGFIAAKQIRNLLTNERLDFDNKTVQLVPRMSLTTNERFLFDGPVATGIDMGLFSFSRKSTTFDFDDETFNLGKFPRLGVDPIRQATRVSLTPSAYTTIRPWDLFSLVPSVQYRSYFYSFKDSAMPDLSRGYLLFQADFSTQLEKTYKTIDPERPRMKHLIRPFIRYSLIPHVNERSHPFIDQILYKDGYNFDNYDVVPLSTTPSIVNYFTPLGNSITYGVDSRLILREGEDGKPANYNRMVEFRSGQTLNILELKKAPDVRVPLSRLFAELGLNFWEFSAGINYYFFPFYERLLPKGEDPKDNSPHRVSVGASYVFSRSTKQMFLEFDRSISFGYRWNKLLAKESVINGTLNYSINDYLLPTISTSYNFYSQIFTEAVIKLVYTDKSRCWRTSAELSRSLDLGVSLRFEVQLNLTGTGFEGFGEKAGG